MCQKASEFGLIERIKEQFLSLVPSNILGIGDDCAVISDSYKEEGSDEQLSVVMTTDMLVEDVHFLRSMPPFDLGVRSVEVNLSDVAAMGGRSIGLLLSLALPSWVDDSWCEEFFRGIHSCGVPLIGGDTTKSKAALCINIVAIGVAKPQNIKYRSDAKVGDILLVGGELGASAASSYSMEVRAQREEGEWLGGCEEVGAMMDLSDGLAGDLRHILEMSEVGAEVDLDRIPVANGASLEQALSGGEDYKLLFSVRGEEVDGLVERYRARFGYEPVVVGRIVDKEVGLKWLRDGVEAVGVDYDGFKHF